MAQAADYRITTGYGYVADYPLNDGFHRGVDRVMPVDTPVIVNGIQIGLSGNTGMTTGAHLHIGRFTQNGTVMNPGDLGFSFKSAKVVTTSFDAVNGNYVRILGDGYVYIYCHLNKITCAVNQVLLAPLPPPIDGDAVMISNTDAEYWRWNKLFAQVRGRSASREEFVKAAVGQTWLKAVEVLSDSTEADTSLVAQSVGTVAVRDNWQGQIESLLSEKSAHKSIIATMTDELAKTSTELTDLKIKYDALQKATPAAPELTDELVPTASTKPAKSGFWVTFVASLLKKK